MKRLLLTLSLALILSLAWGTAVYASGSDSAKGNVNQNGTVWRFSATSNFNGTQPSGTIKITFANNDPNLVVSADVTCLNVVNGQFEAHGVVTDVKGGTFFGNGVIIRGSDAGKFSTTPDTFQGFFSFADPGPCPAPTPGSPVTDGEIVVQDSF